MLGCQQDLNHNKFLSQNFDMLQENKVEKSKKQSKKEVIAFTENDGDQILNSIEVVLIFHSK